MITIVIKSDKEKQDWNGIFKNTSSTCVYVVRVLILIFISIFYIFQLLMSRYYLIIKILFYIERAKVINSWLVSKRNTFKEKQDKEETTVRTKQILKIEINSNMN